MNMVSIVYTCIPILELYTRCLAQLPPPPFFPVRKTLTIRSHFRDVFHNKHTWRSDIIFCRGKYDRIMIKKIYVYKRRGKNERFVLCNNCIKYFC